MGRLKTTLITTITATALTLLVACDQKRYFYAAATNGTYGQPTDRLLDTFRVDTQATAFTAETLGVGIFIMRDQHQPFVDADIQLKCADFRVFADGKLLSAATFSCAPTTTVGAQMRVDATFAIHGKRPQNLLIEVPTLWLNSGVPRKNTAVLRAYEVALELQEIKQHLSIR